MKKKNFIRRIKRNLPETNSSSSHSIIIDTREIDYDPKYWNMEDYIDSNGVLQLEGGAEFDGTISKSNDLYNKILFTCGYVYCAYDFNDPKLYETLGIIKNLILEMTNVKEVNFTWIENRYRNLENSGDEEEEIYDDHPTIDHQSSDMWEEILENKETIKNFLFNKNSWYITTQDGDVNLSFYDVNRRIEGKNYIRIHVGGSLDHIDIELNSFPIDLRYQSHYFWEALSQVAYDKKTEDLVTAIEAKDSNLLYHMFSGYSESTNTFDWGPIKKNYEFILEEIGVVKSWE